jgi:hypothetical protein
MSKPLTYIAFSFAVLAVCTLSATPASAQHLKHVNPIRKVPAPVNTAVEEGYPWFSNDGNLFLFTRQSSSGDYDIFVSHLKDRSALIGTSDMATLPAAQVTQQYDKGYSPSGIGAAGERAMVALLHAKQGYLVHALG